MLRKAKRERYGTIDAREGFANASLVSLCSTEAPSRRPPIVVTALEITKMPLGLVATADQGATFECLERESVSNGKLRCAEETDTSAFKAMPDFS